MPGREEAEQAIGLGRQQRDLFRPRGTRTQAEKEESRRQLAEWLEEKRLREGGVARLAKERGLKRDSRFPGVWLPKGEQVAPGKFPSSFVTHEYMGENREQVVFREHEVEFPINNPGDLAKTLSALNVLYERGENAVVVERQGAEGFLNFVKKIAKRQQKG